MSSDTIIFLELALTLGLVVGFGLWELRKLKRYEDEWSSHRDSGERKGPHAKHGVGEGHSGP